MSAMTCEESGRMGGASTSAAKKAASKANWERARARLEKYYKRGTKPTAGKGKKNV